MRRLLKTAVPRAVACLVPLLAPRAQTAPADPPASKHAGEAAATDPIGRTARARTFGARFEPRGTRRGDSDLRELANDAGPSRGGFGRRPPDSGRRDATAAADALKGDRPGPATPAPDATGVRPPSPGS